MPIHLMGSIWTSTHCDMYWLYIDFLLLSIMQFSVECHTEPVRRNECPGWNSCYMTYWQIRAQIKTHKHIQIQIHTDVVMLGSVWSGKSFQLSAEILWCGEIYKNSGLTSSPDFLNKMVIEECFRIWTEFSKSVSITKSRLLSFRSVLHYLFVNVHE